MLDDGCYRVTDDGQRAIAQEIDLRETGFFRLIFLPLNDRDAKDCAGEHS